jgi:4-amino-4-deoxy-L-arabinose transferase-like glycosyltransferase
MPRLERAALTVLALLLVAALAGRLYTRGGPYFERPRTIIDHIGRAVHDPRDALVLLPKVRPLLPRGVEVTCFRPVDGAAPAGDTDNFFAAVGQLPYQSVMPPFTAMADVPRKDLVEYVVAVREPFTHRDYKEIAAFPEGRLYRVQR